MGTRGPAPKRSDQRRRTNKPAAGDPVKVADESPVVIPDPDPGWHRTARIVWDSLAHSGQNRWYTSTDWSSAYLLCDSISRELAPQPLVSLDGEVQWVSYPPKGASLSAWRSAMAALLMTEGDRRRAAIELHAPAAASPAQTGSITDLRSWRANTST